MNNWWANLNERDKWASGLGVSFLICYLFYMLVYAPINEAVQNNSKQLQEKRDTLNWMQTVQQQAGNHHKAQAINRNKLLTVIAGQLDSGPLKPFPYQLQQTGQGDISLFFDKVPYALFLSWLWSLNNDYTISLEQISVEQSPTPGVVKTSALISTK